MIQIRLLGGVGIEHGGQAVNGAAAVRHRMAMVALLACSPQRQLSRDKLMALLWPEADVDSGQNSVRVALHGLRRVLGVDAILSDGSAVRLNTERLRVDVIEFETALDEGRLEAAVALYRGPFLDGFHLSGATEFDRWMETQRTALRSKCESALRSLAVGATERGAHGPAAAWWRRAASLEPYDSAIALELIRALAEVGDVAGAVRYAQLHSRMLQEDLGVRAPAAILELESELREGRFAPVPSRATVGSPQREAHADPPRPAAVVDERASSHTDPRPLWRRRPLVSWSVVALLFCGGVAAVAPVGDLVRGFMPWSDTGDRPANRVLVLPFANQATDAAAELLGRIASDWITQSLQRSGLVQVIDPHHALLLNELASADSSGTFDTSQLRAVTAAARAGTVVWGSVSQRNGAFVINARVISAANGDVLRVLEPVVASTTDIGPWLERLGTRVAGALATVLDERVATIVSASSPPPTFEAYQEYVRGLDRFAPDGYPEAAAHFARALQLDSTFIVARFWQLHALENSGRIAARDSVIQALLPIRDSLGPVEKAGLEAFEAYRRGDWEGALRAARRAAQFAPQSNWQFMAGRLALDLGRPREALAELAELDPARGWLKSSSVYWGARGVAHHWLGEYAEELATARRAQRVSDAREPDAGRELAALAALGRLRELQAKLESEALAPGRSADRQALRYSFVAQELQAHGFISESRTFYDRCLEIQPENAFCMYGLGRYAEAFRVMKNERDVRSVPLLSVIAARLGRRGEVKLLLDSLNALQRQGLGPKIPDFLPYHRARIAAVLGDRQQAIVQLRAIAPSSARIVAANIHLNALDFASVLDDPFVARMLPPRR